jgi:hypothetical protein
MLSQAGETETTMKFRNLMLGSVCILGLSAFAAAADPQAGDPYTQNPTPQEQAQTDQLNADQQGAATAQTADQGAYQQQMQQYQADQDRYHADQQRYRDQQDAYQDQRAEYDYDVTHPHAWWKDRYEHASLDEFYDIPRDELVDLKVDGGDGYRVGRIKEIERAPDGRVDSVKIRLRDGAFAWVHARDLRYDSDDRIVFTDLTIRLPTNQYSS